MKTSEQINEIAGAMVKAQSVLRPALKDSTNPAFRSKYADLTAVWDACRSPLTTNGITVWQDVETVEHGIAVSTRLVHVSGQWVEFGPLVVPLAKHDAHGVGSATSYGKRYGLSAAVGVVAEDDDGNAAVHAAQPAASVAAPARFKAGDVVTLGGGGPPRVALRVLSAKVVKTGQSGKGPWALHAVKFSDGREATTFSSTVYGVAIEALESGQEVEVTIVQNNGKSSIDSLEPVFAVEADEPPPLMDDDSSIPF